MEPQPSRPYIPDASYGIPESQEGLLPWSYVTDKLAISRNYWVATTRPDGRPHAVPVWGVYYEGTLYFGGGITRWALNLERNPAVAVHLESGDDVVIIEGTVTKFTTENIDPVLALQLDQAYLAKYGMEHGLPIWKVKPRVVFGWTRFPDNTTRWLFK